MYKNFLYTTSQNKLQNCPENDVKHKTHTVDKTHLRFYIHRAGFWINEISLWVGLLSMAWQKCKSSNWHIFMGVPSCLCCQLRPCRLKYLPTYWIEHKSLPAFLYPSICNVSVHRIHLGAVVQLDFGPHLRRSFSGDQRLTQGLNLWLSMLTGPAACLCWRSESGCCSSLSKQEGQLGDIPLPGLTSLCVLLFLSCSTQEERFAFLAEWYDPSAALLRRYQLLYYPKDASVEMVRCVAQISDVIEICPPHKHLSVIYSLIWRTSAPSYGGLSTTASIQRICLLATE